MPPALTVNLAIALALVSSAYASPVSQLATKDTLAAFFGSDNDVKVVAYVPHEGSKELEAFKHAAETLKDEISAAYIVDRTLLGECKGVDCDSPVAIMYKANSTSQPRYEGSFTQELLTEWMESHATPLVARYSQDKDGFGNFLKSWQVFLPQIFVIVEGEEDLRPEVLDMVSATAEANDGIKFFVSSKAIGEELLEILGIPDDLLLPLFIANNPKTHVKHIKYAVKIEDLPEFVREYQEGALEVFTVENLEGADLEKLKSSGSMRKKEEL